MHDNAAEARRLLDDLNEWLTELDAEERIEFTPVPNAAAELAAAAAYAGRPLPPAYADFVEHHGVFFVSGDLTGRGGGNDTRLLSPAEAVEGTRRYREEAAQFEDEVSQEILEDGLLFCADPADEYFHLFVLSSADADGEMGVRAYDYQDPANNDEWHEGDTDFLGTITELVGRIRAERG